MAGLTIGDLTEQNRRLAQALLQAQGDNDRLSQELQRRTGEWQSEQASRIRAEQDTIAADQRARALHDALHRAAKEVALRAGADPTALVELARTIHSEADRIGDARPAAGTPPLTLAELTQLAVGIDLPSERRDILDALDRIRRGLSLALIPPYMVEDLQRELANLILSALRWMIAHGLRPEECIPVAERAQRVYLNRPRPDQASGDIPTGHLRERLVATMTGYINRHWVLCTCDTTQMMSIGGLADALLPILEGLLGRHDCERCAVQWRAAYDGLARLAAQEHQRATKAEADMQRAREALRQGDLEEVRAALDPPDQAP